jgi:methyl-accepting chemotaxis protein
MSLNQRLSNIKISRKLSVGFGVVLFLVAFATILSVLRFKEIRDVYEKTNLIYNINTRIYQAKIARVKFLNGDDQAGKDMAYLVRNAAELATDAGNMSWNTQEKGLISTIAGYLNDFQNNISVMQKAAGELSGVRESVDKLAADDLSARYVALIHQSAEDDPLLAQVAEQLMAINRVRDAALVLRYSPTKEAQDALTARVDQTKSNVLALISRLPSSAQPALQSLWDETTTFQAQSLKYFAATQALKTAESQVKEAGDNSSSSIVPIVKLVKAKNDDLAYSSSTLAALIGVVAILIGLLVSWWVIRQITRPIVHNLALAERIAAGDLSSRIIAGSHDELGQLTGAMGRMNDTLRDIIYEVRSSVTQVSRAASEIASGNTDLSSRTEQQAAAVVETAASMEELTATVKNNADNARNASSLAAQASKTASEGGSVMRDVISTMGDIHSSSTKIADITAVINSIAFQTNILALNAAVEAARAGEQGRGFAVVASEVRNLSQRSSQAAKDIEQLISESVSRISVGSELVAKAGETIDHVVQSVTRVNDIMGEISSASEEQSRGIAQIARAVSELDSTTQQNASLVSESSTAAGSLEEQARVLEELVATFRLDKDAASTSVKASVVKSNGTRPKPESDIRVSTSTEEGWTTF